MPDNYITTQGEKGKICISDEVISSIVSAAISEVEGIAGMASTTGPDLAELLGKKNLGKGIRISGEEAPLTVDAILTVRFGYPIANVAKQVQNRVHDSLQSMTGMDATINVHVAGVAFNKN